MGYRRLETLLAISGAGYWVLLRCRCGHEVQENPMVLVDRLRGKGTGWRLNQLQKAMVCSKCGRKDFTAEHCEAPAIWTGPGADRLNREEGRT